MYNLLSDSALSLDIAFFAIILLGIMFGALTGFIKSVCKWAGTAAAIFFAFTFCNALQAQIDSWFGLTATLTDALQNETFAGWIAIAISFVIILLVTKLLAWTFGKAGTALVDRVKTFRVINRFLGSILGLAEALAVIFLLLMVCKWLSNEAVDSFIMQSSIVSKIYSWDWFEQAATLPFLHTGS